MRDDEIYWFIELTIAITEDNLQVPDYYPRLLLSNLYTLELEQLSESGYRPDSPHAKV